MDRRTFIAGTAALGAAGLASKAVADIAIGDFSLTTVSDGGLVLPSDFLFEPMPADQVPALRAAYDLEGPQLMPECNLALYRDGDRNVLFDVGSGPDFMPTAGKIVDSLDAVGLAPEDITHVVFTHAHPDHIWGLLDDFDDPLFYEASYMMGRKEWDYWWNPETVDKMPEARMAFAVGAKRRMTVIEDEVELFDDGDEILPGISAIASHGHTPGHMAFEIRQGSDAVMVVGDAIGNHHVAFAHPEWKSGPDEDRDLGIQTRLQLLDRLASEQMQVIGFHLPNGGIGRVEKAESGYRFVGET